MAENRNSSFSILDEAEVIVLNGEDKKPGGDKKENTRIKKSPRFTKELKKEYIERIVREKIEGEIKEREEEYIFVDKKYLESLIKKIRDLEEGLKQAQLQKVVYQPAGTVPLNRKPETEYELEKYFLIRKTTGEIKEIEKTLKIGIDPSFADMVISDNHAVSRKHAQLIQREGKLFVKDLGSTNSTYVEGIKLPVETEMEIKVNQELKLADEYFTIDKE